MKIQIEEIDAYPILDMSVLSSKEQNAMRIILKIIALQNKQESIDTQLEFLHDKLLKLMKKLKKNQFGEYRVNILET